jgi:hypothetical protein
MSATRKEYLTDLLEDCNAILGTFEGEDKATIIAAMILADSLNGLRKGLHAAVASYLTIQGEKL